MFEELFQHKRLVLDKLLSYGFEEGAAEFTYTTDILNREFTLTVSIANNGAVDSVVMGKDTEEPYVLHKTNATGAFVGNMRATIEAILSDIVKHCYETIVFKSEQAQRLIHYVENTYGDELEFLWAKFPYNAVWRRKDTGKWYGAILTVQGKKIGLNTNDIVEIMDLRMSKEQSEEILKKHYYYPGWHMNKKSWYTIVLNDTLPDNELLSRIDDSYKLAKK